MTDQIIYKGKPLSEFTLWELELANYEFAEAEKIREEASNHHKFDKINNKEAIELPPINPEFLILKSAIKIEFEKRKNDA